mmetsp:Transcript_294/g.415  ORF Transcript_294/g.415 Transcript_294/m.415 type:complete len:221 (+) Transcript_294:2509-3171(+)
MRKTRIAMMAPTTNAALTAMTTIVRRRRATMPRRQSHRLLTMINPPTHKSTSGAKRWWLRPRTVNSKKLWSCAIVSKRPTSTRRRTTRSPKQRRRPHRHTPHPVLLPVLQQQWRDRRRVDEVVVCAVVEDAATHVAHCLLARAVVAEDAVEAAAVARSNATHQLAPVIVTLRRRNKHVPRQSRRRVVSPLHPPPRHPNKPKRKHKTKLRLLMKQSQLLMM